MSDFRPIVKNLKKIFLFSAICCSVSALTIVGCGGGGGGGSNDFTGTSDVTGQAFRPVSSTVDPVPVPLGKAPITLIDFSTDPVQGATARATSVGETDDNGNFSVSIPGQPIAAIAVNGTVDGIAYRSSGLINVNSRAIQKNFNGTTDIACQALITAINTGQVNPNDVSQTTINNLEDAASREVANTDFTDPSSVTASATKVAQSTNNGANPAPSDPAQGLNCTSSETTCADGFPICAEKFCNDTADCADGSDEDPAVCGVANTCCIATNGCPGETGSDCAEGCCCCSLNEICDQGNFENGCVSTNRTTGKLSDLDSPLSKLLNQGVYY